jgi:hypothetical protein
MLHYQQQRDEVGETNPSNVAHLLRDRRSFAIADVTPRVRLNSSSEQGFGAPADDTQIDSTTNPESRITPRVSPARREAA